ncbi:MAG: 50S ribosomal protein L6 [Candidatus Dadabacteria bacterium]|nr:50S ribosomal protein L6 [Candidatus Dadabacteria bacterium]
MSRIGRKPIKVPSGVKIGLNNGVVEVEGGKGKLSWDIPSGISAKLEEENLIVERENDEKKVKALHGLARSVISNMVTGVSDGFSRTLEIVGVGYRAEALGGNQIKFNLGYSNPVEFAIPDGISAEFEERGTRLILKGIDKQVLGQTAARIRELRPPDSYKGKGVRYSTEKLKLKPGKAGGKG